jgi:hypothetical protein
MIPEGDTSEAAEYGTAFHAYMATLLSGGEVAIKDDGMRAHVAEAHRCLSRWLEVNGYGFHTPQVEVAFALRRPEPTVAWSSRVISGPTAEGHVYEDVAEGEVPGTADLVEVPPEPGPILILDHKTGTWGDYSHPEKLPQLLHLGVAACLVHGADSFIPAILHAPVNGIPLVYEGPRIQLDSPEVESFLTRLARQLARVGDGSMRPGKWCRYCPARSQCPAKTGELLKQAGDLVEKANLVGSELVLVGNSNMLSAEERMGRLHLLQTRFRELDRKATEEIKRAMKEDSTLEPVRPDGKKLVLSTQTRTSLSQAGIKRAYGKVKGDEIIAKLTADGAIESYEVEVLNAR